MCHWNLQEGLIFFDQEKKGKKENELIYSFYPF